MGLSTKATMQATEDQTARFTGSSKNARKARMPPKAKTSTALVVSLGSQSHQTPQVGFAQMDPCMQRSRERTTPISIPASSRLSHFHALVKRKQRAQTKAKVSASIAFQAVGTCTYMIRCTSPMKTSPGAFAGPTRIRPAAAPRRTRRMRWIWPTMPASVLHDAAEEQAAYRPVYHRKCAQQRDPRSVLLHRIAQDDERGGLHRREEHRHHQRKQEEG